MHRIFARAQFWHVLADPFDRRPVLVMSLILGSLQAGHTVEREMSGRKTALTDRKDHALW